MLQCVYKLKATGEKKMICDNAVFLQLAEQNLSIPETCFAEIDNCLLTSDCGQVHVPHRYFWAKNIDNRLALSSNSGEQVVRVPWIHSFDIYRIAGHVKLSEWPEYKQRQVMGIDVASVMAVEELEILDHHHVLDLCCSPGTKMILMASLLGGSGSKGSITGVDISEKRLFTCRSLLKAHKCCNVRLFKHDGCSFDLPPPLSCDGRDYRVDADDNNNGALKTASARKPLYAQPKCLRLGMGSSDTCSQYDRVLVDAECTHDGSVSHLLKHGNQLDHWAQQYLTEDRIRNVTQLQLKLLENGFRNLKPGGLLVYSTCSLSPLQNEDVVNAFLANTPTAHLISIRFSGSDSTPHDDVNGNDIRNNTQRFHGTFITLKDGSKWWTSGFFMAKIQKCPV